MTDTNYYRNQLKTEMGNAALNESMKTEKKWTVQMVIQIIQVQ